MNRRRPRWAWLFFLQLALVIAASALATTGHLPITLFRPPHDKIGHLFAYGGLSFLGVAFFGAERSTAVVCVLLVAAGLEEASQSLFQTRTFDMGDLAMNVVGISVFGAAAAVRFARRRRSPAMAKCRGGLDRN